MAEYEEVEFVDEGGSSGEETETTDPENAKPDIPATPYPKALIEISEEDLTELKSWMAQQIDQLESSQQPKLDEWAEYEKAYTAKSLGPQVYPFQGASGDVVPLIAMAVDPIHARLDTGIFKNDPVIRFKALKKSFQDHAPALEKFVQYYLKNVMRFGEEASPRLLECSKLGTTAFKAVYEHEAYEVKMYDSQWEVIKKKVTRYNGPKFVGVPINKLLFPPHYQNIQQCPIVAEKIRLSYAQLKIQEKSGKLTNCDLIQHQTITGRTAFENQRAKDANHETSEREEDLYDLYEVWFDYVLDKTSGTPARLAAIYHRETDTFLQLRYNWYFHQKKPYVVIPYSVRNDSLYGFGIAEMTKPFQDMVTKWERNASDNAYIANMRMWAVKSGSGLDETSLKMYAGRVIPLSDPKDIAELQLGDTYNSTIQERQNLFGLAEKRTGVSDYLTGRESPIVGSRATATSTMALIQEGTKRVEKVLENIRIGISDLVEMMLSIWIQYGLGDIDDIVFGDDETGQLVRDFFDQVNAENVNGARAIDLAATDASNNKSVQQQMQLAIIQTMMQYVDRVMEMGQQAITLTAQGQPVMAAWINEVAESTRSMFKDFLDKYDISNVDKYLPELQAFLDAQSAQLGGVPGGPPGIPGEDQSGAGMGVLPPDPSGNGLSSQLPNAGGVQFPPNAPLVGGSEGIY
jgi:hypothetical protein